MKVQESKTYPEWCVANDCSHAHCPYDCEHPQPFIMNGKLICGRCYFKDDDIVEMKPCSPENC